MLTTKEIHNLNHVCNIIGKRIVPIMFYKYSPEKMIKWQFNACMQTHLLCARYLFYHFNKKFGKDRYVIKMYESNFHFNSDQIALTYNHSWLRIEDVHGLQHYICDVARTSSQIGFTVDITNNHPDQLLIAGKDKEIQGKRQIHDWKKLIREQEFYSDKTGLELYDELKQILIRSNLWNALELKLN